MMASSAGKRGYGLKGRRVKYWARLGCWVSPCYGPFPLGARLETYERFISSVFKFLFSGGGKPRIRGHDCTDNFMKVGESYIFV